MCERFPSDIPGAKRSNTNPATQPPSLPHFLSPAKWWRGKGMPRKTLHWTERGKNDRFTMRYDESGVVCSCVHSPALPKPRPRPFPAHWTVLFLLSTNSPKNPSVSHFPSDVPISLPRTSIVRTFVMHLFSNKIDSFSCYRARKRSERAKGFGKAQRRHPSARGG